VREFGLVRLEGTDEVRFRHAQHYSKIARQSADQYRDTKHTTNLNGLLLIERERTQIKAGWNWVYSRAARPDVDTLLLDYGSATVFRSEMFGTHLYYDQKERILWLETALEAARRLGRKEQQQEFLGSLGLAHVDLDTQQAKYFLEQAVELGDSSQMWAYLNNLANIYSQLGEAGTAITILQRALSIAQKRGDNRAECLLLQNLGSVYSGRDEVQQAFTFLERALVIARKFNYWDREGVIMGLLAEVYEQQGDLVQAAELMQTCVVYLHRMADPRQYWYNARLEEVRRRLAALQRAIPPTHNSLPGGAPQV
jgi:tetratricopeptide (TPR) repeat protein